MSRAHDAFKAGDNELALLEYLFAAERGIEIAQVNAAWLLDSGMILYCHVLMVIIFMSMHRTVYGKHSIQSDIRTRE
jgi:hypothetical protein